jgi:putative spermidine/putrescine transport system ATP-binding protein
VATVELEGVSKAYGAHRAVHELSLAVASGESVALLGPSGCGKTTTLNMIAGFLAPDAGHIRIDGRAVDGVPPYRRNIGMVFQHYALFPHLTVADNLAFGLRMRKADKAEITRRVGSALELVHLDGLERRYPRELSGGQQQRVALARALVVEPAVLLLDEPLSNLDAKLRQAMREEIVELQQRLGITTIFVTHDQEEALAIARRIAVMDAGRVEQIGAPEAIYGHPRTEFVARFIGEANLLPGEVLGAEQGALRVRADMGSVLRAPVDAAFAPGDRVLVMVRPEKIRVGLGSAGAEENRIEALVKSVSFLGAVTRCQLTVSAQQLTVTTGEPTGLPAPGQRAVLTWATEDCRLLAASRPG